MTDTDGLRSSFSEARNSIKILESGGQCPPCMAQDVRTVRAKDSETAPRYDTKTKRFVELYPTSNIAQRQLTHETTRRGGGLDDGGRQPTNGTPSSFVKAPDREAWQVHLISKRVWQQLLVSSAEASNGYNATPCRLSLFLRMCTHECADSFKCVNVHTHMEFESRYWFNLISTRIRHTIATKR